MYPLIRLALTNRSARKADPLSLTDMHVSQHRCWPQDLDVYMEMNNGRVLTLLDLGRFGLAGRTGLLKMLKREGWGLAVAGGTTRYRKRILPFVRFEMRTRTVGWDHRFIYMEQSIWIKDACAAHVLLRTCLTDRNGIVGTDRAMTAMGHAEPSPALPKWVSAWIEADTARPWPPEMPSLTASR
jgi:acyl-CoA thioesterase FadM